MVTLAAGANLQIQATSKKSPMFLSHALTMGLKQRDQRVPRSSTMSAAPKQIRR